LVFTVTENGAPPPNGWRAFAPGPVHVAPWAGQQVVDVDSIKEGGAASLQSRFRLKEPVDGKLL
jgi:hypothetical protein